MNYFELYDIPVSLTIDKAHLKKKYIELSRKFHPDFHTDSSEEEQNKILELSTQNNQAFKTLSKDELLIPYVLEIYDMGGVAGNNDIPNEFLMEMMDLNEELMEVEMDENPSALKKVKAEILTKKDQLNQEMSELKKKFEQKSSNMSILGSIKEVYLKQKYINRIESRLN